MKRFSALQKWAWFFAVGFLGIVILSHWPGLTDAQGRLMGLFYIDPIDDIFHLISGVIAVVVALKSELWSLWYFRIVGIPYALDAATGMFFSREFLNGDIFTKGFGPADFSMHNFLVNFPHIIILLFGIWLVL